MPYSSYLLNLYGCSVVTLLTSLLLQWSLKCLWDHPRVATIISLWPMSWKNSRVYASVISRDGRSRNLGQIMLSKCWKRTQQQWENQRFVMMSWTKRATVHFGEDEENWEDYPKSALLALNASIHIIHTPMQRMLENVDQSITIIKISLIIPQDMSTNNCSPLNTCLQVKVVSYGLGFCDGLAWKFLVLLWCKKTMHSLLLLWLSIIFQTWGPSNILWYTQRVSSSSLGLCGGRVIGIIGDYASILIEAMIAPSWDTNLTLDNTLEKKTKRRRWSSFLFNWRKSKFHFFFLFKV